MYHLLSKNDRRKVELLKLLGRSESALHEKELCQKLEITPRILDVLCTDLQKEFGSYFSLLHSRGTFWIEFQENYTIIDAIHSIYRSYDIFRIIGAIFKNNNLSLEALSNGLFLSPSTIYRAIRDFNQHISSHFSIQIASKPYRFLGEEREVRHFFTRFFLELYRVSSFPFSTIQRESLEELLEFVLCFNHATADFSWYRRFLLTVAVSLVRYQQGFSMPRQPVKPGGEVILEEFCPAIGGEESFRQNFGVPLDVYTLYDLFFQYILPGFYLNVEEMLAASATATNDLEHNKMATSILYLMHLLTKLSEKHALPIDDIQEMILELHNNAFLEAYGMGSCPIVLDENEAFLEGIWSENPIFFEDLRQELSAYYSQIFGVPKAYHINKLLNVALSNWGDVFQKNHHVVGPTQCWIISHMNQRHGALIQSQLQAVFGHMVKFRVFTGHDIRPEALEMLEGDLIITDCYLPTLKGKELVQIDLRLNERNMTKIFHAIEKTKRKRGAEGLSSQ